MKVRMWFVCMAGGLAFSLQAQTTAAQSGGAYRINQLVIATGGKSAGGAFSVEDTVGQPMAGRLPPAAPYSVYLGFWSALDPLPTASAVSVGGRVIAANGQGIRKAVITLTNPNGSVRTALTGGFGYYHFADVTVGETYVLSIASKRFIFSKPVRVLDVTSALAEIDFIAEN